jgi:uncharacterized cupredoxin-like copper-binding protein
MGPKGISEMLNIHSLFSRASNVTLLSVALLSLGSSLTLAAGGHDDKHGKKVSIGEPGIASEVSRTIEITMQDNLFDPESISVKEGETVKFIIKNTGEFVHEFNIGTALTHAKHQKEMMMMMKHGALEADKINHQMMKMDMGDGKTMMHNDPNSVLLEPSKSAEIIWKFTTKAKLEFACNVPGHYESGMMGHVNFS